MQVTVTFDTDNEAFEGNKLSGEVARILRNLSDQVWSRGLGFHSFINDSNGNIVGEMVLRDNGGKKGATV